MCVLLGRQSFITPVKDIGVGVHIYIICLWTIFKKTLTVDSPFQTFTV